MTLVGRLGQCATTTTRAWRACGPVQPRPPLPGVLVAPVQPRPPLPGGLRAFVKPRPPLSGHNCSYEPFVEGRGWGEFQFGGFRQEQGWGRFHLRSHAACGGTPATLSERRRCGVSPTVVFPVALATLLRVKGRDGRSASVGTKAPLTLCLSFTGDPVVVAIELRSITRIATIDGSGAGSACFGAVLVIRSRGFLCGSRLLFFRRFLGRWGTRGRDGRGGWSLRRVRSCSCR